jgi:hypothetical protein
LMWVLKECLAAYMFDFDLLSAWLDKNVPKIYFNERPVFITRQFFPRTARSLKSPSEAQR